MILSFIPFRLHSFLAFNACTKSVQQREAEERSRCSREYLYTVLSRIWYSTTVYTRFSLRSNTNRLSSQTELVLGVCAFLWRTSAIVVIHETREAYPDIRIACVTSRRTRCRSSKESCRHLGTGESDGEEVKVGDTTDTHPSHALARLFRYFFDPSYEEDLSGNKSLFSTNPVHMSY